jgi:outer membrane immunogenic protein
MIRRILLASAGAIALSGAAFAADLHAPPPPPPPYVPLPWTGFYVGLNAGYEWSNNVSVNSSGSSLIADPVGDPTGAYESALVGVGTANLPVKNNGFIGGGQIGYNFQFANNTVASAEADIEGIAGSTSTATRATFTPVPGFADSYTTAVGVSNKLDYFGTLRGRYGYLFTPSLLVYGTGGFAWGGTSTSVGFVASDALGFPTVYGSSRLSTTSVGWTAGGGLEWMFAPNWTAKVEYLYYELSKQTSSFGYLTQNFPTGTFGSSALTHFTIQPKGSIVRVGVNYLFNWGTPSAVVAKY